MTNKFFQCMIAARLALPSKLCAGWAVEDEFGGHVSVVQRPPACFALNRYINVDAGSSRAAKSREFGRNKALGIPPHLCECKFCLVRSAALQPFRAGSHDGYEFRASKRPAPGARQVLI